MALYSVYIQQQKYMHGNNWTCKNNIQIQDCRFHFGIPCNAVGVRPFEFSRRLAVEIWGLEQDARY